MTFFNTQLPEWAAGAIAWLSTGTNIASLIGIFAAIIKLGAAKKENRAITNMQIELLNGMLTKLSDTRDLVNTVHQASARMDDALKYFESAMTEQRESNAHLAMFVMECFNRSNLTAEAKAELQVIADRIFYNDNTKVIEALKTAKAESDAALTAGLAKIAQLEKELEEQRIKLATAQENVRETRKIS